MFLIRRLAPFALAVLTGALIGALTVGWIAEVRYGAARVAERDALLTALGQDVVIAHAALRVLAPDPLTRAMAGAQAVRNVLERQKAEATLKTEPSLSAAKIPRKAGPQEKGP